MEQHKPSEAELEILQVLWQCEPCTVKLVHEKISEKREIGYTTTLKQMQRMLEKGLVTRASGSGKSHVYSAALPADEMRGNMFDRLLETAFGNSVGSLVMHALGNGKASQEEVDAIRQMLDQIEDSKSQES